MVAEALATVVTPPGRDLHYIHVGDRGGLDELPLSVSMSNLKAVRIMGSGMGSWSKRDLQEEMTELVQFTAKMKRLGNVVRCKLGHIRVFRCQNFGDAVNDFLRVKYIEQKEHLAKR